VTERGQNVYAKAFDGARFRVNPRGVNAGMGGIDGTMLAYQEYVHRPDAVSDIHFVDLATGDRSEPPSAVNTSDWELKPSIDGASLLFGRQFIGRDDMSIILFDLESNASTTLMSVRRWRVRYLDVGQVNDNFATWGTYTFRNGTSTGCHVFVHDIAAGTTHRVPNANDKCQYAPSVDAAGTVYFARSGFGCGLNAAIWRYSVGGNVERVETLADGQDLLNTFAVDNGDGTTTVYLDPGRCTRDGAVPNQDIEAIAA
jgi:VCBS repeat-containing protein